MNVLNKLFLLGVVCLFGCSHFTQVDLDPSGDNVYISNGVEQYYLSDLPSWANFSSRAKCFRKYPVRYLDFEKIFQSYNLNYTQAVFLQHMINRRLFSYKSSMGQAAMSPKDESFIFQNSYQKVAGGGSDFIIPQYKKVSVIWLDSLKSERDLKKVLSRKDVQQGHPIILSMCKNSFELEEMSISYGLEEFGLKFISSEMFSIFDEQMKRKADVFLNLKELLSGKVVSLYRGPLENEMIFENIKTIVLK